VTALQVQRFIVKPVVFVASLGPVAWLTWAGLTGHLSANPLSDLTNETGLWAIRFLCISLAVTPLRRLTGWNAIIKFRRMMGLYAFFYGSLHFLIYTIVDRFAGLDFPDGIVSWTALTNLAASVGRKLARSLSWLEVIFSSLFLAILICSLFFQARKLISKPPSQFLLYASF